MVPTVTLKVQSTTVQLDWQRQWNLDAVHAYVHALCDSWTPLGLVYIYRTDGSDMNLQAELSEKDDFYKRSIKSFCLRSFFRGSDCSSSPVVSSGPKTACWGLCVGPDEGRPGPSLYINPTDPRLGTLSAYNLKIHDTGVPKSDSTQQVSKMCSFLFCL